MRMARTVMLEVLRQDYIRTAWSKGLKERTVVMRHALKGALMPVVSYLGPATANIIGKFATGIADDFLSTFFLANRSPVMIAPAMNSQITLFAWGAK